MKKKILAGLALGILSLGVSNAQAATIELALVLDGSGSISHDDWDLQVEAYKNVFTNSFYDAMNMNNTGDTLWVKAFQFSDNVISETGWNHITSNASASTFGNLFTTSTMSQMRGWTNTDAAIDIAAGDLRNNQIDSDRMVIDISTDGEPTRDYDPYRGPEAAALYSAQQAYLSGVTTNLIGIGNLDAVYMTSLAQAGGGFYVSATNFTDFEGALRTKLYREINNAPVPEPATMLLLGTGIAGLAGIRRRKNSKA